MIAAADGPVLSDPTFRRVIDSSRTRLPTSVGCVIDAALAADAVAVSGDRTGVVIVIVSHGSVAKCPALSKVAPEVWTATIGAGSPVRTRADSVLADDRWARARPYLVDSPIAVAADLGARHVVAAAQADPIDVWVTIDATDTPVVEQSAQAFVAQLGGKLAVTRQGAQVIVRGSALTAPDLDAAIARIASALDVAPPPRASTFACPPAGDVVISCLNGTQLRVRSVARALHGLLGAPFEPVVANGDVVGLRLTADAPLLLRRGDLIVAVDSRTMKSVSQLAVIEARVTSPATVTVRRGAEQVVIELRE